MINKRSVKPLIGFISPPTEKERKEIKKRILEAYSNMGTGALIMNYSDTTPSIEPIGRRLLYGHKHRK
tara:strand:+ start:461 stop:664 length:204 start_codon:yes stop_codon:yes gene_type:complete